MTATMPDIATDRFEPIWIEPEAIAPVTCQSWCADGSGHTDVQVAEDQWCHGREHRFPMRLEGFSVDGGPSRDYLTAHSAKTMGEEPKVFVGHGEGRGVYLTPGETELWAQHLLLVMAEVRSAA